MVITNERTLLKRVKVLSNGRQLRLNSNGPVIYWMNRDQRGQDNWGLIYAQKMAENLKTPLVVVFCLVKTFLKADLTHYHFMMEGLKETVVYLKERGIPFHLFTQPPEELIPERCDDWNTPLLVTDFNPLRIKRDWESKIIEQLRCPVHQVDAHNIVPCWEASHKLEYAAYTFRPRILRKLDEFLVAYPPLQAQKCKKTWEAKDDWAVDPGLSYKKNQWHPAPGTTAGRNCLENFLKTGIHRYASTSNNPLERSVSRLSPYLHFGQVSPARCALEVIKNVEVDENRENFLEQLIVRRELSDNFCYYQPLYDSTKAFAQWARNSLEVHQYDQREYLYHLEDFQQCHTHDNLWNAAQKEMKLTGYLHGYLRMYWAKKILEWTPDAETAQTYAITLNDTYLLDGRDPNGYVGIAWSIGGIHDRAWVERPVFGKIRYMNEKGCRRKFDVDGYIGYVENLEHTGGNRCEPNR